MAEWWQFLDKKICQTNEGTRYKAPLCPCLLLSYPYRIGHMQSKAGRNHLMTQHPGKKTNEMNSQQIIAETVVGKILKKKWTCSSWKIYYMLQQMIKQWVYSVWKKTFFFLLLAAHGRQGHINPAARLNIVRNSLLQARFFRNWKDNKTKYWYEKL